MRAFKGWSRQIFGQLGILCFLVGAAHAQLVDAPAELRADAELAAVTFVNADDGWAVGDRGTIWHTSDGGRNWKLQQSGVSCRLEAVQFLDALNGVAVGGRTQSYTHQSHGVVLRTRDGGRTWQSTPDLTLPGLRHVKFLDAKNGWAIGDSSALYPSGVFRTNDGGRTWSPVPNGGARGWVTGDFPDLQVGAVAGLGGAVATVQGTHLQPSNPGNLGPRYLRRLVLPPAIPVPMINEGGPVSARPDAGLLPVKTADRGWLVGDGGLILTSTDGGKRWSAPSGELPALANHLDCRALSVRGLHVWVAGAPGTHVLHSPDGGQTWEAQRTGQTLPLRSLCFIDEYRGWAVGSLGTILHTRDGGQSWRRQRSGGSRLAMLGVFSSAERVPFELFALESGGNGYLGGVTIIGRRDWNLAQARPRDLAAAERFHAAIIAAGGSHAEVAWRFPLTDAGLPQSSQQVLALWDHANEGQAIARLEEHLVRQIRQWRPETIVTEDVSPRGDDPLAHLANQVTLAAVQRAAEGSAYSQLEAQEGLEPWKAKKVLCVLPSDKQGVINVTPAQWSPRLGRSLAEAAQEARSLISTDIALSPRNLGLSVLVNHLPQETGTRDLFSGITLGPGGEARRQLGDPPAGDLEQLSRLAQKRHNIEQLLSRIDSSGSNLGNWLGQIDDLTRGLGDRQSGEILWQLADRYLAAGRFESAAEARQLLLEKHPQHPLADQAALWLVQYYASSEVAWRNRHRSQGEIRLVTAVSEDSPVAGVPGSSDSWRPEERASRAIGIARQIERTRPVLHADPALRFPLAAALRSTNQLQSADQFLLHLAQRPTEEPWAQIARAESWLTGTVHQSPKPLLSVVRVAKKPKLDGRLDDEVWQSAKPVALKPLSPLDSDAASVVALAYDDEFLYLTASCRKRSGFEYLSDSRPRVPDEDLSRQDRVTLAIDTNRDYASFWELTADYQGRPSEICFGDRTWNPEWFIAAGGDAEWWTIEAAIPLAELTPKKPEVREVWGVQIQRLTPSGLQAFSQPSSPAIRPEGFGLMIFE